MIRCTHPVAISVLLFCACAASRRPPQPPKQGCGTAVECYAAALVVLEETRKSWEFERQNLKVQIQGSIPIGTVIAYAAEGLPVNGWLPCDGQEYPIDKYPKLSALLGTRYGKAVKPGHFSVPDYQGYFLRAWDPKKQRDAGDSRAAVAGATLGSWNVGGVQPDLVGKHTHPVPLPFEAGGGTQTVGYVKFEVADRRPKYTTTEVNDGIETRPKNVSVVYLIRAD